MPASFFFLCITLMRGSFRYVSGGFRGAYLLSVSGERLLRHNHVDCATLCVLTFPDADPKSTRTAIDRGDLRADSESISYFLAPKTLP